MTRGTRLGRAPFLILAAAAVMLSPAGARPANAQAGALDPSFGNGGLVTTPVSVNGEPFVTSQATALAIQDDGRIVTLGWASTFTCCSGVAPVVGRYQADGTLDPTFGNAGFADDAFTGIWSRAADVAILPDGRIVALTEWNNGWPTDPDIYVVRYNADGTLDESFDGDGGVGFEGNGKVRIDFSRTPHVGAQDLPRALAIEPDGDVIVTGVISEASSPWGIVVARVLPTGGLDRGFGDDGRLLINVEGREFRNEYSGVALQDDGRILVTGVVMGPTNGFDGGDIWVGRYMPDGSPDVSYGVNGQTIIDVHNDSARVFDLALQSDGKLVIAGRAQGHGTARDFYLVRLDADGSLDPSFDGDGKVITDFGGGAVPMDEARAVTIDAAGRIILAGQNWLERERHHVFAVARYHTDGSLDTSFGEAGLLTTRISGNDLAIAAALQPDGKLVVAGSAAQADAESVKRFALARYETVP